METGKESDAEDIIFGSLQWLYGYQPIVLTSPGSIYTYVSKYPHTEREVGLATGPARITLRTPDTEANNWSLHASSIWTASVYLADHLSELNLDEQARINPPGEKVQVLELGAAAGLPSILIAKEFEGEITVIASDYPDEKLIRALEDNIKSNGVASRCRAIPCAWGSNARGTLLKNNSRGFDVVIAADTLWNPDSHASFIDTLQMTLKKTSSARVHLVIGLHTGRYTIQSFMDAVQRSGFEVEAVTEREAYKDGERDWDLSREEAEDEKERRRWIIWIKLRWKLP